MWLDNNNWTRALEGLFKYWEENILDSTNNKEQNTTKEITNSIISSEAWEKNN